MIVPILKGGLGNQMFQIANAFAFAKRNSFNWGINYNFSFCPNQGNTAHKYKDNFYQKIPSIDFQPPSIYNEPRFNFDPIPAIDNILLDGFFQSEKYFGDYSNEVKELFTFSKECKLKVDQFIKNLNHPIVGIHIRRGDYIRLSNYHKVQKSDYYIEASKVLGKSQAIICTDDWASVQKEMKFTNAINSPFTNEIEDLYLLSQCDSLVICNSSFSWWGAYLGKDKEKVIAPKNWFGETGPKDYQDIYREGWICL